MDENKIIRELDERTGDVKVPEKLLPENIMNTIKETNTKKKVIPFSKTKKIAAFVSAAAVLAVTFTAFSGLLGKSNENVANTDFYNQEMGTESLVVAKTGNVDDYSDVYKVLEKYKTPEPSLFDKIFNYGNKSAAREEIYFESATMAETSATGAMGTDSMTAAGAINGDVNKAEASEGESGGFSKTNVQTVGIDEADIIKTDGKYIYYASSELHTVTIYSVDGEKTEVVNNLYVEGLGSFDEIYIDGDTMIATGMSYRDDKYNVAIAKYDIADRANPKFVGVYSQEGNSIETRKVGNVVYIVTKVHSNVNQMKENKPETYIPSICGELIDAADIFIEKETEGTAYTVISTVDVSGELTKIDSAAVLGFSGTFYMGNESMYLYRQRYVTSSTADYVTVTNERFTEIRKIDYEAENGLIGAVLEGKVPGVVKDTFAVNEHNGYLRIMTTSYPSYNNNESVNNVFVLNQDLSVVGSIEGLAKGERIYSARYMGDVAYFVTYRETDPLFSVDLSNPESPKIMGALKIPGFSEYLHGYGDGKLLGIGIEQREGKEGWNQDYIKISMFDTSDPYNVTEEDKKIIKDANYSHALYNYKAVMIDPEKNIFAFVTQSYYGDEKPVYRVFTYTGHGFEEIITHEIDYRDAYATRSVYIGDYVYIVNDDGVMVYSLK